MSETPWCFDALYFSLKEDKLANLVTEVSSRSCSPDGLLGAVFGSHVSLVEGQEAGLGARWLHDKH